MSSTPHEPHTAQHTGHHQHSGHDDHAGHNKHAGHDPEMFRRRFWISLILVEVSAISGLNYTSTAGSADDRLATTRTTLDCVSPRQAAAS